ncbi:MAG: hypothetical protein ACFFCO_01365 [Promethearchaeota archaeon]
MSRFSEEEEIRAAARRIAAEFEATYGTLEEKVNRVPDEAAAAIAEKCGVHMEVARVAYRILLDGTIPKAEHCCSALMKEFTRREERGNPVPDIASYIRAIAIREGQWVEYLYRQLGKELHADNKDLENRYLAVRDEVEPASEHIISVIRQRRKIGELFFKSLISRWINDHEDSTIADAILAIIGGLRRLPVDAISRVTDGVRAALLMKFRRYEKFLLKSDESRVIGQYIEDLRVVIREVQKPLDKVSELTAEEILVEAIPPPQAPIDDRVSSSIGFVHSAFPTQPRVGPPLESPLDLLERDVWLAAMQDPHRRAKFLQGTIKSVTGILLEKGAPLERLGTIILFELDQRFTWNRSKRTEVRRELAEIYEIAGEDYRMQIENYLLEKILTKIPQLRTGSGPVDAEE